MTENFVRHLISFLCMLVVFLAWFSGYYSAPRGWWWTAFSVVVVYGAIYQLLEM